jgi:hypothetical protein
MYRLSKSAGLAFAIASLVPLAGVSVWIAYSSSEPRVAEDYEECADQAKINASSGPEYSKLIIHCGERFAGRRKAGGGYAYFDFMQNKTFDIAGPNPTESERKQIDYSYMEFLGTTRRERILSELMKAQANIEQAGNDRSRQNAGSALPSTPNIPLPAKRPVVVHSKTCDDGSLSCGWARLSAAVRNALASSSGPSR